MSEILDKKSIKIREDYVDATERCALIACDIAKGIEVDMDELKRRVEKWKRLRRELLHE